jgi:hypothetical protein
VGTRVRDVGRLWRSSLVSLTDGTSGARQSLEKKCGHFLGAGCGKGT